MGTMNGIDERFDGEAYLRTMVERGLVKFAVGQLEKGETGNIHLQYYIQRERQTTFATIKRQICPHSHWEVARGTLAQCVAYVTKEDTRIDGPWQFGTGSTMGGRTDLAQAAEAIRSGMDIREVALEFPEPFIKYHKGMMAYKSLITSRGPRKCPLTGQKCGSSGGHRHRQVPSCLRDMAGCLPQDDQRQVVGRLSRGRDSHLRRLQGLFYAST